MNEDSPQTVVGDSSLVCELRMPLVERAEELRVSDAPVEEMERADGNCVRTIE